MKRNDLVKYKKKVNSGLNSVESAISKGAYLSAEEWFDFNFKCAFVNYHSLNALKYMMFNRRVCKFAKAYAKIFECLIDIAIEGFNNDIYIYYAQKTISLLNPFIKGSNRIFVDGFDRDGVLYLKVILGARSVVNYPIRNKNEAIKGIKTIVRYCTEITDIFSHDEEFGKFIKGYISRELSKFLANIEPTPYVCDNDRLTLYKKLYSKRQRKGEIISINTAHEGDKIISIG